MKSLKIFGSLSGLAVAAALVLGANGLTGCKSVSTVGTNGVVFTQQTLDTNIVVEGITAVVPIAVAQACAHDANAAPYFTQAVILIRAAVLNGDIDPVQIKLSLATISIRELRSDQAVLAEEAGLALYKSFAGQVVSMQLDKVTWLKPVLSGLADAIEAGIPTK